MLDYEYWQKIATLALDIRLLFQLSTSPSTIPTRLGSKPHITSNTPAPTAIMETTRQQTPKHAPTSSAGQSALEKETGVGHSENVELVNTNTKDEFKSRDEMASSDDENHEHEPRVRYYCYLFGTGC